MESSQNEQMGNKDQSFNDLIEALVKQTRKIVLLEFLKSEIDSIESKERKNGWSPWILCAAIAPLISYFFSSIESGTADWNSVGLILVFSYLVFDLFFILKFLLKENIKAQEELIRYTIPKKSLINTRMGFVVLFFRCAFLFVVFEITTSNIPIFFSWNTRIFLLTESILFLLTFLLTFLDWPIPNNVKKNRFNLYLILVLIVTDILSIIGHTLWISNNIIKIQDWKIGLSSAATLFIVLLLANSEVETPAYLGNLKKIKQRLALNMLDPEDAVKEIEKILFGLTLYDAIHPFAETVLTDMNSLQKIYESLGKNLLLLGKSETSEQTNRLLDNNEELFKNADLLLKKIEKGLPALYLKSSVAAQNDPEYERYISQVKLEITNARSNLLNTIKKNKSYAKQIPS